MEDPWHKSAINTSWYQERSRPALSGHTLAKQHIDKKQRLAG